MNNLPITLNQIFVFKENELSPDKISEIESSNKMLSLKEKISKEIPGIKWNVTLNEVVKKIGDLLNISLADIMVGAWNKYRTLQKYLDQKKYSPEEIIMIPLAEHKIKSVHRPYIEILINDQVVGKIEFSINITLTLEGIILKVQNAKIKEILTGTCKAKGTIKCENFVILEKDLSSISLPGSIALGEGIPIPA